MKATTEYWVGIKHVGDRDWPEFVQKMQAKQMAVELQKVIQQVSLASRIELVIARTEVEVTNRLNNVKPTDDKSVFPDLDESWDEIAAMEK